VPVENRTLLKEDSELSQGSVVMWVDILTDADAMKTPKIQISGPEKKKFEIRIVCWRSLDVPALEGGVSDMFVSFFMEVRCTTLGRDAFCHFFLTSCLLSFWVLAGRAQAVDRHALALQERQGLVELAYQDPRGAAHEDPRAGAPARADVGAEHHPVQPGE